MCRCCKSPFFTARLDGASLCFGSPFQGQCSCGRLATRHCEPGQRNPCPNCVFQCSSCRCFLCGSCRRLRWGSMRLRFCGLGARTLDGQLLSELCACEPLHSGRNRMGVSWDTRRCLCTHPHSQDCRTAVAGRQCGGRSTDGGWPGWAGHRGRGGGAIMQKLEFLQFKFCTKFVYGICSVFLRICGGIR